MPIARRAADFALVAVYFLSHERAEAPQADFAHVCRDNAVAFRLRKHTTTVDFSMSIEPGRLRLR